MVCRMGDLPVVSTADDEAACLVELDVENGRYLVSGEVRMAEDSLHAGELSDLSDLDLPTRGNELVADA